MPAPHVLIAGVSARAAAESAARAGFTVDAVDAFGDLDQHPLVRSVALPRDHGVPFSAAAAARVARAIESDAVAYLSSFENHPTAVARLAAGRALWGNPPSVLRRVRSPALVARTLRRRGFAAPAVVTSAMSPIDAAEEGLPGSIEWLLKPLASGGGHGVRPARADGGQSPPRGWYLQRRIEGDSGSVVFVAAGGRASVLGISRQLVGDAAFGATGFRYCGSILLSANELGRWGHESLGMLHRLAGAVAEEFALVGLNGIDFVMAGDAPYPTEVNPRWCSSMELVDEAGAVSVFAMHAAACRSGELPSVDAPLAPPTTSAGKAVVFARDAVRVGDTSGWLADPSVRDVPRPGERIDAGRPVCTVFANAASASDCYGRLVERAAGVYEVMERWWK